MKDIKKLYKEGVVSGGCACNFINPLQDEDIKSSSELLLAITGIWEGLKARTIYDESRNVKFNWFFGGGDNSCTKRFVYYFTEFRKRFPEASDKLDDAAKEIASDLITLSNKYLHGVDYSGIFSFLGKVDVPERKLYGQHRPQSNEFLVNKFCGSEGVSGDLCEVPG